MLQCLSGWETLQSYKSALERINFDKEVV